MGDTVKLSPRVRVEDTSKQAVPSIPPRVIEPFLSRPLVIEPDGLDNAPRIVAAQADRVFLGSGDIAYVSGIKDAKPTACGRSTGRATRSSTPKARRPWATKRCFSATAR